MRDEHAEQRHEDRAEQEQEALVAAHVDRERADGRGGGSSDDEHALRDPWEEILGRDRRRVHVRKRLVRLVHGQGQQRERRSRTAPGDRSQDQLRVVRVDTAGEDEDRAEPELEESREQVADPDAEERASPVA